MPRRLPTPRLFVTGGLIAACLGAVLAVTTGPALHRVYRTHQLQSSDPQAFASALDYFGRRGDPGQHPAAFSAALDAAPALPVERRNALLVAVLPASPPLDDRLADALLAEARTQPLDTALPLLDRTLATLPPPDGLVGVLAQRSLAGADPQPIIRLLEHHALWSLDRVGPAAFLNALRPLLTSTAPAAPVQLARQLFIHPSLLRHPQGQAFFDHLLQRPEPYARDAAVSIALAFGLTDALPDSDPHPLIHARLQPDITPPPATQPKPPALWTAPVVDLRRVLPGLPAPTRDRLMLHLIDTLPEAEVADLARSLLLDFDADTRFAGAVLAGLADLRPQTVTGDTTALAELLRDDPALTVEDLLKHTDAQLAELGLRRVDALTHAIATTDDPQQRLRLQLGEYLRTPSIYPFATAITRDPANASTYLLAALHRPPPPPPPESDPRFAFHTLFPPIHRTTADLESWAGNTRSLLTDAGWWPVLNRYLPGPQRPAGPPTETDLHRLRDALLRAHANP